MRALVAAILWAASCASAAHAEIIHFINPAPGEPGHYDWHAPSGGNLMYLDITASPAAQLNEWNPSSVGQTMSGLPFTTSFLAGATFAVATVDQPFVLALELGDTLLTRTFVNDGLSSAFLQTPPGTVFPTGERRYIGVLTTDGRYGWIEVERAGGSFTAYSWAYETVPGIPITAGQVPAPGAAVLLGVGAFARRRSRT